MSKWSCDSINFDLSKLLQALLFTQYQYSTHKSTKKQAPFFCEAANMGSDPQYARYPDLSLAQDIFTLTNSASSESSRQVALSKLQNAISDHKMAPLYRLLAHPIEGALNASGEGSARRPSISGSRKAHSTSSLLGSRKGTIDFDFPWDEQLYEKLKAENEKELETIAKEEEEAAEKAGDTEVQAAKGKRAELWARVGDKVNCSQLLPSSFI